MKPSNPKQEKVVKMKKEIKIAEEQDEREDDDKIFDPSSFEAQNE